MHMHTHMHIRTRTAQQNRHQFDTGPVGRPVTCVLALAVFKVDFTVVYSYGTLTILFHFLLVKRRSKAYVFDVCNRKKGFRWREPNYRSNSLHFDPWRSS